MLSYIKKIVALDATSGMLLLLMLAIALALANSPLHTVYLRLVDLPIHLRLGTFIVEKPLVLWVNEGLMAIFFMLLALEIKREICDGELSKPSQLLLPVLAAIAGIAVPVLIYVALNHGRPDANHGWPIATTTDIAFAMGLIALLGKRVPPSLKTFLIALSIVDDIFAVVIIAVFYTSGLSLLSLGLAAIGLVLLVVFNFLKIRHIGPYLLVGVFIWFCVLKSGVHATLAGVAIGLAVPYKIKAPTEPNQPPRYYSPLRRLETGLHPWVAFMVLPLFVLINGGIPFAGFSWGSLLSAVPLGIALGLFVGKTFGVFASVWLAEKFGLAARPLNSSWQDVLGLSALTGIGFTMSLFITALAFEGTVYENIARQGVLLGSLLSCLLGCSLFLCKRRCYEKCPRSGG